MIEEKKYYRCGWCGQPTTESGDPNMSDEDFLTQMKFMESGGECESVPGSCCREQEEDRMMQVTREMAIDAGDPALEGQWIRW